MDDINIDIDVLERAVKLLFGENGADMLRKTYNAMHDAAEHAANEAYYEGYEDAREDLTPTVEQLQADEAQRVMERLYEAAADQAFDEPPRIHATLEGSDVTPSVVVDLSELDDAFEQGLREREAAFNE